MIHPSYSELMQEVNKDTEVDEPPVVNSRYSIVLATSRRARQIIGGDTPLVPRANGKKPLSVAIEELYQGEVKILPEDSREETESEEEALKAIETGNPVPADTDAESLGQESNELEIEDSGPEDFETGDFRMEARNADEATGMEEE